jgi:signal transduction histidine kinase
MEVQLRHAQKLESIGQLAAGIAHEINTPTQYVGDNLHFLQDSFVQIESLIDLEQNLIPRLEAHDTSQGFAGEIRKALEQADAPYLMDEIPKALEQAIEGVGRISTLVRAMKEFSHPGQKEKTPSNLNRAIESTITVARNEWKYVADMAMDLDPSLPPVPCLVNDFNQVILNLIVNSAHAIKDVVKDSGTKGTITIRSRKEAQWAEVRVGDTGSGIPEAVRARIFDPFFTTKSVGKGSGQGLAIARSVVVDKHGGTIDFETETGRGTEFVIRLPLGEAAANRTLGEPVEALAG